MAARERGEAEARALEHLVEVAVRLEESGVLDLLEALADRRVVESASRLLLTTGTLRALDNLEALADALGRVAEALGEPPEPLGVKGLLDALRDPRVQRGLGVLVNVLRALGEATS